MAIDVGRVVQAAIEAATQGPISDGEAKAPKPRLSAGRALLIGAGLVTVGRLAAPRGREMLSSLQQRLEQFEPDSEDEEQETDGDFDEEYDYGEEPEDEGDEDFDEEDAEHEPE